MESHASHAARRRLALAGAIVLALVGMSLVIIGGDLAPVLLAVATVLGGACLAVLGAGLAIVQASGYRSR